MFIKQTLVIFQLSSCPINIAMFFKHLVYMSKKYFDLNLFRSLEKNPNEVLSIKFLFLPFSHPNNITPREIHEISYKKSMQTFSIENSCTTKVKSVIQYTKIRHCQLIINVNVV